MEAKHACIYCAHIYKVTVWNYSQVIAVLSGIVFQCYFTHLYLLRTFMLFPGEQQFS